MATKTIDGRYIGNVTMITSGSTPTPTGGDPFWEYVATNVGSSRSIYGPNLTSFSSYSGYATQSNLDKFKALSSYCFYSTNFSGSITFTNLSSISVYGFAYAASSAYKADFSLPNVTSMASGIFYSNKNINTVYIPQITAITSGAFYGCSFLTEASFGSCVTVSQSAFYGCSRLSSIGGLLSVKTISPSAFYSCYGLSTLSFPSLSLIWSNAFGRCYNLISLYLGSTSVCALSNANAFTSTPISNYTASAGTYGSIFVPASLVSSYKTATNWVNYSARITSYTF